MFSIEMLPADEGDSLWIEYGEDVPRRLLIDCGRKTAYRAIADRLEADPELRLELLVLTHVDADHIAGALPLLQDARFGAERVKDIWFNGWRHLNGLHRDHEGDIPETLGARQGEFFGALLRDRAYPWNETFDGYAAFVEDEGPLPRIELDGGMVITLLGPTREKMHDMRERWADDLQSSEPDKHLDPGDYERALELLGSDRRSRPDVLSAGHEGPIVVPELVDLPFEADDSEPNGSSIAFLAEFDGKSVLFAGDAHAPQIESSIARLLAERGGDVLAIDALKMAHHGSARNNSSSLLELLDCPRYLVSTNGARHHHPDPEALARVLDLYQSGTEFYFNYASDESLLWDDPRLKRRHRFETFHPEHGAGLKLAL